MTKGVKTFFVSTTTTLNTMSILCEQVTEKMKSGPVYERVSKVEYPAEGTHYAAFTSNGDDMVKLHSRVFKYIEGPLPESFLDILRVFTNQNMCDFVYLDNDEG